MVFIYRAESSYFSSMDDFALNDVTLILDADMDVNVSTETHMKYYKLLILRKKKKKKKVTDEPI
jgi:hypothetical protein